MRVLTLISALFIASCGFQPVYGVKENTQNVQQEMAQIDIGNIPDREGQFLRNTLIDRFYLDGRPLSPQYRLTIGKIVESARDLDVTIDSDTTRGQLTLSTSMKLIDLKTQQTVLKRSLRSIASYNIIASEFANRVSEQNTRENALDDLSRQIEEQLALYFRRNP